MKIFLVLFAVLCFQEVFGAVDYCTAPLCKKDVVHVACNTTSFHKACGDKATQIKFEKAMQQLIVDRHNALRSQIAMGKVESFPTASNMSEMTWDDELAYIAGFNARQCVIKHDACRATTAFPFSGQNLAWRGHSSRFDTVEYSIRNAIDMWFNEYKQCPPELVNELGPTPGKVVGHFTAIVHQKNSRIGCAMTQYMSEKWYETLLTCNYAYANMFNEAIYSTGKPCAGCLGKCSTKNPGLCV